MTLFGTRKGLRKLLPMAVITSLVLTMSPMTSHADSVSPLQLVLELAKLKKKKQASCPCKPCCASGACCPNGTCCPAGGCCDQSQCCPLTGVCPLGSCPAIAPLACCAGQCAINDVLIKHGQLGQNVQFRVENMGGTPVGAAQLHGVISHVVKQGNVVIVVHQGNGQSAPVHPTQGTFIKQFTPAASFTPDLGVPIPCCQPPKPQAGQLLLDRRITMSLNNVPLTDCLEIIGNYVGGVKICIDDKAIQEAGISAARPISMNVNDVCVGTALSHMLKKASLTYKVENGSIKITAATAQPETEVTEVWTHNISDVLRAISALQTRQASSQHTVVVKELNWLQPGIAGVSAVVGAAAVYPNPQVAPCQACQACKPECCQCPVECLIDLIQKCVAPESWTDAGGNATIQFVPIGNALVVRQSPCAQGQICCILNTLRHLQASGLISKPTGQAACERCPAATCDQCPGCYERVLIRIVKPEQCQGFQCTPAACCPADTDVRAVFKKYADELQRLCSEYQREVDELQDTVRSLKQELTAQRQSRDLENCVRDLQQDLYNLRQEVQMSRMQQQVFAPPYQVQPVSMPAQPMSPTFFFMPAGSAGQTLPMPTPNGPIPIEFRIPR